MIKYKKDCEKIFNFLSNYNITHSVIVNDDSLGNVKFLIIDIINDKRIYKVSKHSKEYLPFIKKIETIIETEDIDQALLSLNSRYVIIKKIQENLDKK